MSEALPLELTDEDAVTMVEIYLDWCEKPGTAHASLIRAAYKQGLDTATAQLSALQAEARGHEATLTRLQSELLRERLMKEAAQNMLVEVRAYVQHPWPFPHEITARIDAAIDQARLAQKETAAVDYHWCTECKGVDAINCRLRNATAKGSRSASGYRCVCYGSDCEACSFKVMDALPTAPKGGA